MGGKLAFGKRVLHYYTSSGTHFRRPHPRKITPDTHHLFTALLLFQSAPVSALQSLYSLAHVALPDRQVNLCDIT